MEVLDGTTEEADAAGAGRGATAVGRGQGDAGADEIACRRQVFGWLVRYNARRRHSWCRYQSPVAYETGYTATLPAAA